MLDTAGKVLKKLIRGRLVETIRVSGDLSGRQFGFRTGRSTVDVVMEVIDAVQAPRHTAADLDG